MVLHRCVIRVFSKIHSFLRFHIHHVIVITISMDQGCESFLRRSRTATWVFKVLVGMIPTISQRLLVKPHFRKGWSHVSSFYCMQFSHVYESSYMVLVSIALVFSLSCRSSQKKSFCFSWHLAFQIWAMSPQSHSSGVPINSTSWIMLVSGCMLRVSLSRHEQV